MEPRLTSSTKWTEIPKALIKQIKDVFEKNFKDLALDGDFHVEGRIYPAEITFRLGYLEDGRISQINFETSVEYTPQKTNPVDVINLCVDTSAALLETYLDDPKTDFPREWKAIEFNKNEVFIRFTTVNTELEAEADRLLGEDQDSLVKGDLSEPDSEEDDDKA